MKLQQRYRIEWDVADRKNEGVLRVVWQILIKMEVQEVSLWWVSGDALQFPMKIWRVLRGYFEHQRRVRFEGCLVPPLQTVTAIFQGQSFFVCFCMLFFKMRSVRSPKFTSVRTSCVDAAKEQGVTMTDSVESSGFDWGR